MEDAEVPGQAEGGVESSGVPPAAGRGGMLGRGLRGREAAAELVS